MPSEPNTDFTPFAERMRAKHLPEVAIRSFRRAYHASTEGTSGFLAERDIEAVTTVPHLDELDDLAELGRRAMQHCCVVKLNGGLGTSMGLEIPKSLVEIREGLSFLDIIVEQSLAASARHQRPMPLVLMNSFRTAGPTSDHLAARTRPVPESLLSLIQHRVPKVDLASGAPVEWPEDPELTWCPPGHGDLYAAILSSGVLDELLESGMRHAFVSNVDNLGASFEPAILGLMVERELPFLMEVTTRTEVDRKGGHLARLPGGRLGLREVAQCPETDLPHFQNIERHPFFNTNNLWLDLVCLRTLLDEHDGVLPLPVIQNRKTVDPTRPDSPAVLQLETAMGSAISLFEGAEALAVPRRRFAPVKTCADLLAVSSDAYRLTEDWRIELVSERTTPPVIELDGKHYKRFQDFSQRFPDGPPSLLQCDRLTVHGDVRFGAGVVLRGDVHVEGPAEGQRTVPDGTVLNG